jgi:hypothetical protein
LKNVSYGTILFTFYHLRLFLFIHQKSVNEINEFYMRYIIELSKSVKTITALTILIVLSVVVYAARHILMVGGTAGEMAFKLSGLFLIIVILLVAFAFAPKELVIGNDKLILVRRVGKRVIPLDQIRAVSRYEAGKDIRLFASGGYFGYYGYFTNAAYGRYEAFVGSLKQAFAVTLESGKVVVLSCADAQKFIVELRRQIAERKDKGQA